jgi:hypothetical protein
MADELATIARMRVEALRDALVSEAGKLMGARDVSDQAKELLSARTTMLDVRVTEMLNHIEQVEPAYARLRLLACVEEMVAGSFQVGAGRQRNEAVEKALAKYRDQTRPGRSARTTRVQKRQDEMSLYVFALVEKFPGEPASAIARRLRRNRKFEKQFLLTRRTVETDVAAIMKRGNSE